VFAIESCAGRVSPCGLRVPAYAGQVREPAELCMQVRAQVELGAVRDEKFFARVTEY